MTTINHVAKGQSDWQANVNEIIDVLNQSGEEQIVQIDDPFTYLNGSKSVWHTPFIRYIQLNGYKLVELNIDQFTFPYFNGDTNNWSQTILVVPKEYAPDTQVNIPVGDVSFIQLGGDGKGYLWYTYPGVDKKEVNIHGNVHVVYIRKDN